MKSNDEVYERVVREGARRRRRAVALAIAAPLVVVALAGMTLLRESSGGMPHTNVVADGRESTAADNESTTDSWLSNSTDSTPVSSASGSSASVQPEPSTTTESSIGETTTTTDDSTTTTDDSTTTTDDSTTTTDDTTTTTEAPGPHTYMLTNDDVRGKTVHLDVRPGDHIGINLARDFFDYSCCRSEGDSSVIQIDSDTNNDGSVEAAYTIVGTGSLSLLGSADPGCRDAVPACEAPSYVIDIEVSSTV